jgi:GH25 family lysozyme M1 (1,4-beta-N-acetylmuramidase)
MRNLIGPGAKMGQANPQSKNKGGYAARGMAVQAPLSGNWQPSWGISGVDVSAYQSSLDWGGMYNQGVRFAYVKASEGNYYTNDQFSSQYFGSQNAGMIRGAYHFAVPNWSSGADQANYFVSNGGGWSPDGITLPPVLDIEYNPYAGRTINGVYMGNTCYSMSAAQMVGWINDFSNTVLNLTGRRPVIYSTTDWWSSCTGNSAAFSNNPLWIAAYNSSGPGTLPASWGNFSIWQYSSDGPFPGDSNIWNGDYTGLQRFATYGDTNPSAAMGSAAARYSKLGNQTSGIACGLASGGCYQMFQGGALNWSPATGAFPTYYDAIRGAWQQSGFENGPLGYPTSDEVCGLVNGGCYQAFQGGAVNWSASTGAQLSLFGPIRSAWGASGFENGPLGYPTTGKVCGLANGGCYQMFQGGAINWSQASGAQLSLWGPIRDAWAASGFENGPLGYPTTGKVCGLANGGCYQMFQGGSIVWSSSTGAQQSTWGAIRNAWAANNFQDGRLGYPTSSGDTCGLVNGGCFQMFQGGSIVWSPTTGAQLSTWGAIRNTWANLGYQNSRLGYPTTGEVCSSSNSCTQKFQGGSISWGMSTGISVTYS